jgi:hypothetical protein
MNSTVALQPPGTRTINRGVNPFAPIAQIKNKALTTAAANLHDPISNRIKPSISSPLMINAIAQLKAQLGGQQYEQHHFGVLKEIEEDLIDCNIDIQRLIEETHIAVNIIPKFDPRIIQVVNVIYIKATGRYSVWEGQQSSCTFALLKHFGLIKKGVKIQCKVIDDDMTVPGSPLTGEGFGNAAFRAINFKGRKSPDQYYLYRSMVSGARIYGSTLREDRQALEIQEILERHNMFPAPAIDAKAQKATPGMVTHISGVMNIAGHDTEDALFDMTKTDLDWAFEWHDTYFNSEKGVDGGFILAFGRLHAAARESNPEIKFDKATNDDFARHMKAAYGSPKGFHQECKNRLQAFQDRNHEPRSWSDSCLTPLFVMDYQRLGGKCIVPIVKGMTNYAGV